MYFKSDYHFYYGANVTFNKYTVWPNKFATFWRVGLGGFHSNNLATLTSFNYETMAPFFSNANSVTTKNKTGTAYNYDEIKSDFTTQLSAEIYLLPLNSFLPGIYFSGSVNNSDLYKLPKIVNRENDKILVPIEGGLVFNISSKEKDKEKSILSISFYSRFEDITDKTRVAVATGETEEREDFLKRNLSFGLKVGIPITLPQRK